MKIKLTSIYVNDQEKALRFYTESLGFVKKADFTQGPFRWLTVASPEEPDGTELQLALNNNPAAQAYQKAMFEQGQPAAMFYVDDVKAAADYLHAKNVKTMMGPIPITEGPAAGQAIVYFNAPWGLQLEAISYPKGMAYEKDAATVLWTPKDPAK